MVPPLSPVKPLGPLNLCEEAAMILEGRSAEVLADPFASPTEKRKAVELWPDMASGIRQGVAEFRRREASLTRPGDNDENT